MEEYSDKNGVGIHEGDIVLDDNGYYYEVSHDEDGGIITDEDGNFRSTLAVEHRYIVKITNIVDELNKLKSKSENISRNVKDIAQKLERSLTNLD